MEPQVKMSDPQARVYIEAVVAENGLLHCCKISELILDKYGISLNNKKISHVCNRYGIQYLKIKNYAENGKKINQKNPITQMILDVGSNAFLSYKEIRNKIKEKYGTDVHEGQIRNVLQPIAYIDKAVQGKKPEINQAFNQPKLRTCLTCKDQFLSDWIGNRVCQPCKQTSPYVNGANDSYGYRR